MFTHIEKATVESFMDGNHKCNKIGVYSKSGSYFEFIYDICRTHIEKANVAYSYENKSMYFISGDIVILNKNMVKLVKAKIGLPDLNNEELGRATKNYIKRSMEE